MAKDKKIPTNEIQFSKNWQYVDLYGTVTNTQALLENKNQIT